MYCILVKTRLNQSVRKHLLYGVVRCGNKEFGEGKMSFPHHKGVFYVSLAKGDIGKEALKVISVAFLDLISFYHNSLS